MDKRGNKRRAEFKELRAAGFDALISKGNSEVIKAMYTLYSLSEELGIDDWHTINTQLAANIVRTEVALLYRDIQKNPDISDRHFYNMLVDQAMHNVADHLKTNKDYAAFKDVLPRLKIQLDRMR